jgi:hypothetical protein
MRLLRWLAIFFIGSALFLADTGEAKALRFLTTADVPNTALWGAMSNGFRLSLSLNSTSVQAGDPVLATIDLENLGPDRDVVLGCNMEEWYDIRIVDSQHRAIPHNRIGQPVDCYSTSPSYSFKHNSVLEITLRLDDKFQIREAGSYSVTAMSILHPPYQFHVDASGKQLYDSPILASPVSNALTISVRAAPSIDRTSAPVTPKPTPTVDVNARARAEADTPPCRSIDGLKTGLFHPARGLALFDDGAIAVSDESGAVSVFDRFASGNVSPMALIRPSRNGGRFVPLAIDEKTSELYVGNLSRNTIDIYQRLSESHLNHVGTLRGSLTALDHPASLTIDSTGNLYVVDLSKTPAVLVFKHGSIGDVAPVRRISGPATGLSTPVEIAVSESGEIFVSNDEHYPIPYSITVYSREAVGNARPTRSIEARRETISSVLDNTRRSAHYGRSQLNNPFGLSIASNKYLIVANARTSTIGIDNQGHRLKVFAITPPITAYDLDDQGDATPAWTINGPSTGLSAPLSVASDRAGNLFVQNYGSKAVVEFCAISK